MTRWFAAALALVPLAASASPADRNSMTLAVARRLSPQQLAERLLGAVGTAGNYSEATVSGDGGIMIHMPGLNHIDLYKPPTSAGFRGLCQVDSVHVSFSTSRYNAPGDPPHHVTDFWKSTAFAMLAPTDKRIDAADWDREERDCAQLAPVVGRTDPMFFAVAGDKAVDAYFAMRALAKAKIAAGAANRQPGCRISGPDWGACKDAAATLRGIPIDRIHYVAVSRCVDGAGWCVTAHWMKSFSENERQEVEFTIRTDATKVDPPTDFTVTSVDINAGTTVDN
ncbi:hypothetical protein U1839_07770 [Sphingomonas sp. RT2P30]|uniref:hypothetical protein n=1 Tax=Parasphingomonas halimpatiens TaxID=3096162 RepID=UPI002FCB99BB